MVAPNNLWAWQWSLCYIASLKHFSLMKQTILYASLLLLLSSQVACTVSKQLKSHRNEMSRLANESLPPRDKFDGLATEIAMVLNEATDLRGPVQTFRYLQRFSKQNGPALESLTNELEPYINNMNTAEKVAFVTRAMTRPYGQQLVRLIPKVNNLLASGDYKLGPLERTLGLFALKRGTKNF